MIIRKIRLTHCKRGPALCARCRDMDEPRICLLDVSPPNPGESQRRIVKISAGSGAVWRELDVIRVFESTAEGPAFAQDLRISDVELDQQPFYGCLLAG